MVRIGVFSRGLARVPHLDAFLGADEIVRSPGVRDVACLDAVAGWGHKSTADRARAYARRHGLPYLAVEDGFLRSLQPGRSGGAPMSLVVDDLGIYYDAGHQSRLEAILNDPAPPDPDETARSGKILELIQELRLSKYNMAPDPDSATLPATSRQRVLVVDQTRDDMSVRLGQGTEESFRQMLGAALDENPGAEIIIKPHPETVAGTKRGYLTEMTLPKGVRLLKQDVNPFGLLAQCEKVYAVTSQLGFEAALAGREVHCHGLPFYAGWGITRDQLTCPRRTRQRTPLEVFSAAMTRYARYVDPITGQPCDVRRIISLLERNKRTNETNRGTTICLGIQRWKRGHLRPYLASTGGQTVFASNGISALRKGAKPGDRILVWGGKEPAGLHALASQLGVRVGRIEDGFLRSVGLGSDFIRPASLVIDWHGAYWDPERPNDLERILAHETFSPGLLDRAARLRARIVDAQLSKYNIGHSELHVPNTGERRVLLVPGQVEGDVSVRMGGMGIHTNLELVRAIRQSNPDAFIAFKPHPDVVAGNRSGGNLSEIKPFVDALWSGAHIHHCMARADEVHTLTSLTGFEALLRGKRVVTYGGPFYAGWGLTRDRITFPRRGRQLSLDELVAGVLILYPSYYDWDSRIHCGPEETVERLIARKETGGVPADSRSLARPGDVVLRMVRLIAGWMRA